jgi:hypothetical protein
MDSTPSMALSEGKPHPAEQTKTMKKGVIDEIERKDIERW